MISLRTTETTSSMYTVFRLKNRSCWKTQSIRFRALSPAEFLPTEARTSSWSLLKRASKLRSLRRASSLPARLSNQVLLKRSGVENAALFVSHSKIFDCRYNTNILYERCVAVSIRDRKHALIALLIFPSFEPESSANFLAASFCVLCCNLNHLGFNFIQARE